MDEEILESNNGEEEIIEEDGFSYEYPIFDQTNQEITNPDLTKGYLRKEYFTVHRPAVPEVWHYQVVSFEFNDGEIYTVKSQTDPHIKIIDAEKGIFEYQNLAGEKPRIVVSQVITTIVDQPMIPAYDNTETFYRYVLYTEKELADKDFLENGPAMLSEAQTTIEDLLLLIAELVGGNEESDEEEEPSEEPNENEEPSEETNENEENSSEEPIDNPEEPIE
jgi:hypothetical protein